MTGLWTSGDRWTCPECGETTVIDTSNDNAVHLGIRLAQTQHAGRHAGRHALDVLRIAADGAR